MSYVVHTFQKSKDEAEFNFRNNEKQTLDAYFGKDLN